ncbi:CHAT domain-containing protein [Ephemerocybe angulata]|uniref:CHAT domain-containing protein n=1 Tax=Ephemerocybe angulata TaxID=980116 RepID=A0A8H6HX77_9AGAR|nr:CHAT domain-containing protein [Tulosesus angulatus]
MHEAKNQSRVLAKSIDVHSEELTGTLSFVVSSVLTRNTLYLRGNMSAAATLSNQAKDLQQEFQRTGDIVLLDEAILLLNRALGLLTKKGIDPLSSEPDVSPETAALIPVFKGLGEALGSRFVRLGDVEDIDLSVRYLERATRLITGSESLSLDSVRNTCPNSFLLTMGLNSKGMVSTTLNNFAVALTRRYGRTGGVGDIDYAVTIQRMALEADGHGNWSRWNSLGTALIHRYEQLGRQEDLDESLACQRTAFRLGINLEKDEEARLLSDLGTVLMRCYTRMGKVEDSEESMHHLRASLALAEDRGEYFDSQDLIMTLNNLGACLMRRFLRLGNLVDINEAISAYQQTLKIAPEDHPARHTLHNNIGLAFFNRHLHSGDSQSIQEAANAYEMAVAVTPPGHPTLPLTLNNLASALHALFDDTGDASHIEMAVATQGRAIRVAPQGYGQLAMLQDNLGMWYRSLYDVSKDPTHIEKAIVAHQAALDSSSPELHEYPVILSSLARALRLRFMVALEQSDIRKAIRLTHQSLKLIPGGHSSRGSHLASLANSHQIANEVHPDLADAEASIAYYSEAAQLRVYSPLARLNAAKQWAAVAMSQHDKDEATAALDMLVELVGTVAGMEQPVRRRYEHLAGLSDFILNAGAFGIFTEQPSKTIEWLEHGRGLVWTQVNTLRTPLDELHEVDPVIAENFQLVSRRLESAAQESLAISNRWNVAQGAIDEKITLHGQAALHVRLAKEREDMLHTIRTTIPGFESFLRPPSITSYMEYLPEDGFVVLINMHPLRCDALALVRGREEPISIPLTKFSWIQALKLREILQDTLVSKDLISRGAHAKSADVVEQGDAIEEAEDQVSDTEPDDGDSRGIRPLHKKRGVAASKAPEGIKEVLQYLWEDLVQPIIEALALSTSSDEKTRIWWCPTGPITFLPIHAAGVYRGVDTVCLTDYAVSSYIPTIATLNERVKDREQSLASSNDQLSSGLFMVSQPDAPGLGSIPGTTDELDRIEQCISTLGIGFLRLDDEEATVDAGLQGMEKYSCIHLACHASQDSEDPLRSGFFFLDGELQLSEIFRANLKSADLAFLSACQTSTGCEKLTEEAVHLAAGMLSAGYTGVVATMWSIHDEYAPDIADDFYKYILDSSRAGDGGDEAGKGRISGENAAFALHHAADELRKRLGETEASFLAWVPYVHFGL